MESEENKREIILSNETKNLTDFSSTRLITRGQKLADLLLFKNPLMNKVEEILLKEFSKINNNKSEHALFHKIRLAIALLEIRNKSTEGWSINILNEESEKSEDIVQILNTKKDLIQVLSNLGKREFASEYVLRKFRESWSGVGFHSLLEWSFNLFSDKQISELIKIFSNADETSKIGIINEFEESGRKQKEVISYLQGISQNDTNFWIRILACDALINLEQPSIAKNALIPISRGSSRFVDDAKILLGLIENNKESLTQVTKMLLRKIQEESNTFLLLKHISCLPKIGEEELAVSLLLDLLDSLETGKKENNWKYESCIDELIKLNHKGQNFLDRLIHLSTDSKTDFWIRRQSFYAILEFESINASQAKKLLALLESDHSWVLKFCAASVLANFQNTEDVGVDLLIRFIKDRSIVLDSIGTGTSKIITENKRLAYNSKFLKMLYDLPEKNWGTSGCLTIIKMLKKAKQ